MKNQINPGNTIDVPAPYALSSGDGCLVGSLFGIAAYDAILAANVTLWLTGGYAVKKLEAQAWAVGELIYWDDANKWCTNIAGALKLVGIATAVAANPSTTGHMRLNGAFIA